MFFIGKRLCSDLNFSCSCSSFKVLLIMSFLITVIITLCLPQLDNPISLKVILWNPKYKPLKLETQYLTNYGSIMSVGYQNAIKWTSCLKIKICNVIIHLHSCLVMILSLHINNESWQHKCDILYVHMTYWHEDWKKAVIPPWNERLITQNRSCIYMYENLYVLKETVRHFGKLAYLVGRQFA